MICTEHKTWIASPEINTEVSGKEEQEKQAETYLTDWLLNGSNMAWLKALLLLAYDLLLMPLAMTGLQPLMSVSFELITS